MNRPARLPTKTVRAVVPDYRFIDKASEFERVIDELCRAPRYGIDTEFVRERTYFARLALVQIAWEGGIVLVDPLVVDIAPLSRLFATDALAIFHAGDQDLEIMVRACGVLPTRIFDTQLAAGFIGMSTPSLQSLIEHLLHLRLEKGDQLTDWSRRPLEESQLTYAAGDVAFLFELHDLLVKRLVASARMEWAEAEFQELLARSRTPTVPEEAWWRLKHARQLRGRDRQVAQCVAAWRERRAQELDLPTRFVLSDLAMASIAQRPPKSRGDLSHVRNIDARNLGAGAGEELFAAITAGLALDPAELHLPPSQPGDNAAKPAVMLAACWVGERAHQLSIDPAILATRADLTAYLRDIPSGRLTTSWRQQIVGEPIRRLIAGEASLALEGGESLVLEERSHRPITGRPRGGVEAD